MFNCPLNELGPAKLLNVLKLEPVEVVLGVQNSGVVAIPISIMRASQVTPGPTAPLWTLWCQGVKCLS